MTRLLRDTFEDWADEARVPHDLADRALRRRAWRPVGAAALVAVMIAAVALFVTGQREPEPVIRPADGVTLPARPSPAPTDVRTDTADVPPKKLIAAGRMAVSAYYVVNREAVDEKNERLRRTWHLYDPRTGGYERTPYVWADVAPGLQVAAVLEGDLLSRRLGVLDLNTRRMLTWIDLEHPVGSVVWSPDGTRILATAYSSYPDDLVGRGEQAVPAMDGRSSRTGYYIVDVREGTADYHELPPMADSRPGDPEGRPFNVSSRQDLGWSLDGTMIYGPTSTQPDRVFFTLDGQERPWPEGQRYVGHSSQSATSPNGKLVLGAPGLPTKITDAATGAVVGRQKVLQLHAWADDDNVLAMGCAGECENEFNSGLVLVSVDGSRMTQLSLNQDNNLDGSWRWVLTPR